MSDFTPIETQEDFDKAIKSRLAQKDREMADKYKGYLSPDQADAMKADFGKQLEEANKQLKEAQDKIKSFDTTVSELTKRAETAECSLLKNTVAIKNKLPIELASRLVGTTEEELTKDAESLVGILKPSSAPPLHTGTQSKGGTSAGIDAGMTELLSAVNAQLSK